MKDELGGKIITEFVALRPKTYSYLTDDDKNVKEAKATKQCVTKRILKFNNEAHCVYTEEINKIALHSNDDKKLQTFDRITTYLYGTNAFKVCESEMLSKYK